MKKTVTTIEESRKLLELGINPLTYDAHYRYWADSLGDTVEQYPILEQADSTCCKFVPAWSAGALLKALPVISEDIRPVIERCWNGKFACKYLEFDEIEGTAKVYSRRFGDTPVDAAYAMAVLMLKQQKEKEEEENEI